MGSSLGKRSDPHYTRHLREFALEELFAAGEAVEALVEHPGWVHVQAIVDAEIAEIDRSLDGREEPLSQAQYALKHGRRGGLTAVRNAVDTTLDYYRRALDEQRAKHEDGAEPSGGR